MPRTRFASPFAYQTPIGASLNNIAQALFAGPGPIEQDRIEAASELARANAQRAAMETRKTEWEIADLEDFRRRRGDPYQNETIALGTGVPLPNVEGYRSYIRGGVPMPPALPGGVDHGVLQDRFAALRTGTMDKTSTALDIAKAGGALTDQRREAGAQSGVIPRLDVENFARARAATEGKPLYGGDRFVTRDLSGGGTATTALGAAEIPNINAQAAQRRATAGNQASLADLHREERRTGIKAGPPVMVDVPNIVEGGGGPTSVSPQRTGGFPLIAPPRAPTASSGDKERKAVEARRAQEASADYAEMLVNRLEGNLRDNPRSTTGPASGLVRGFEATANMIAPEIVGSEGTLAAQTKESLITAMAGLKKEGMGRMSNQDMARIDRSIGLISSGTPEGMRQGLRDVRDTIDVVRGKRPRSLGLPTVSDSGAPPVAGARRSPLDGQWYVADPQRPRKYMRVIE